MDSTSPWAPLLRSSLRAFWLHVWLAVRKAHGMCAKPGPVTWLSTASQSGAETARSVHLAVTGVIRQFDYAEGRCIACTESLAFMHPRSAGSEQL